jgi:FkbM family methyltransferase
MVGVRSRLAHQDAALAGLQFKLATQGEEIQRLATLVESCVVRLANDSAAIKLMSSQYQDLVSQRDRLLNERDRLLVGLQKADRPRGLASDTSQVHAHRLPFPRSALPSGTIPKVRIIDVGAQNLSQEMHIYQPLVDEGAASIIAFEPLQKAAEERSVRDPSVQMLNHFIGDGSKRKFYINKYDPTSSLLAANLEFLNRFEALATMCSPVRAIDVITTRLDDIPEATNCDFLKIDVQGGELEVLRGASRILGVTVVVHCEVEFAHVYKDQPLFGDIDAHLRGAGFELIDIINTGYATVKALPRPIVRSRLLWGEAIYMRSPESVARLSTEKIAKAAFIAHTNYGMYDVAASLLAVLDRNAGTRYAETYGRSLTELTPSYRPETA